MYAKKSSDFIRRGAKYKAQPIVLIICEDTKSSKTYLEEALRSFRSSAKVEVSHCGKTDPKGIVSAAVARSKYFNHVYCVFDRDSHHAQNFEQALALAKANADKVTALVSYPCFEFWLILHFEYTRSPFAPSGGSSAADVVLRKLKSIPQMIGYSKGEIDGQFEKLMPYLSIAKENARKTILDALSNGNMNPSTSINILIDRLEELGKPVKI